MSPNYPFRCYLCDLDCPINPNEDAFETINSYTDYEYDLCISCYNENFLSDSCIECFREIQPYEIKLLLDYKIKIEKCIFCLKNKKIIQDFFSEFEIYEFSKKHIAKKEVHDKNIETDPINFTTYKVYESRKYIFKIHKELHYRTYKENTNFYGVDWYKYKIGDTVYVKNSRGNSKRIIINDFCNNCRCPNNEYNTTCNDCSGSIIPHIYQGKYNICRNCRNLFKYKNKNDILCEKCIIEDWCTNCEKLSKEVKEYNNLMYKVKAGILAKKHKINRIKIEKDIETFFKNKEEKGLNKRYEYKKFNKIDFVPLKNSLNKYKEKISNINKLFKEIEKDYEYGIKLEKQTKYYYEKLHEKQDITDVFKSEKLNNILNKYKQSIITEYELSLEIGKMFVHDEISSEDKKQFSILNNTRPAREIIKCKRIYLLKEFVDIKNIALSGISNFLRDCSEEKFEYLLSLFH